MAAKPTILPTWNTSGANRATPTLGQQASGYTNGQRPASAIQNWLFHHLYKWVEYLKDGALDGNHTIAGTLGASGLITGSAGVATTTVTASGSIAANGGVVAGANQDVALSGTGRVKRANWSMALSPVVGVASNANISYDTANHYLASTGPGTFTLNVPIRDNVLISSIETECYGNGSCLITTDAFKLDAAGQFYAASGSLTPLGVYSSYTINSATLAANWLSGQTFSGLSTLSIKLTFGASGGRVSRIVLRGSEV